MAIGLFEQKLSRANGIGIKITCNRTFGIFSIIDARDIIEGNID